MTPEKLFENGPEWELDECGEWDCRLFTLLVTLIPQTDETWVGYFLGKLSDPGSIEEAVTWLRARIIAHRDELLKVAPVEYRWTPVDDASITESDCYVVRYRDETLDGIRFFSGGWCWDVDAGDAPISDVLFCRNEPVRVP